MIEGCFHFPAKGLECVLRSLFGMPIKLRPIQFGSSEGERELQDIASDEERLRQFIASSPSGFFLYSEAIVYCIRLDPRRGLILDVEGFDLPDVGALVGTMADAKVEFGYVASSEERLHRNRLFKETPYGKQEAWVGRDSSRYLPGLYWKTLVSRSTLDKHSVKVEILSDAAIETEELTPAVFLFSFYSEPENWRSNAERLDQLCESVEGIFSIAAARSKFFAAQSFLDSIAVTENWP